MGKVKQPLPVKLVFSLLTSDDSFIEKAISPLTEKFGEKEELSEKFDFTHTRYYEKEMGKGLFRRFLTIKPLISRENIAEVKLFTNEVEERFSVNGKRRINIDPGYITLENFVLFTTKNYTHRIYLQKGIYAEITLIFHKKEFHPLAWTYPDYAEKIIRDYLKKIREKYREQLKDAGYLKGKN